MFEWSRLPFLYAVHEEGSVAAAARSLGYTPSAVSQQIAKLEREVGRTLLEPAGRGVVLTDAALVLVDAARTMQTTGETTQARLEELEDELTGTLRVACFPSAIRGVASPALGALAAQAPGLRLRLREMSPDAGHLAVVGGRVDVALVHDWVHDQAAFGAGVEAVYLVDDVVELVVPAGHRLGAAGSADLSEVVDDVWVTDVSRGICTRWILAMLREHTERPRMDFRAEEYASQVALVGAGLCVGLLPRHGRPPLPDSVHVVPLRGAAPTRRFIAVYRSTTTRRPAVHRLIEQLQAQLETPAERSTS
ncbi:MAG: LysR family transcriptional regulator [Ornithinimicrobium sp.]|uniref:LysR family transcriptional regulator n=1 Tax=Ornithinimicrobium sp. TaxID=1977084 RepID=UPI003D9AF443